MTETNATDPVKAHIDTMIAGLPLERKVRLLTGSDLFSLWSEPSIGLGELRLSDGPTGVRGSEFTGGRISCLLPNATLLAQHWDTTVAGEAGSLLAEEALAQHVHVVLGPTINLHRTPLGGRLFEAFSEDPLLTGALAAAYVHGLQRHGVGATPKHFLANESEFRRTTVDSVVDEKTLRETYLLPFEMVVDDAHPWAVMAAYNRVNGITATEHFPLVEGVLKDEWGYDGLVVSDWYATTSTAASVNGGLDLVMPGPGGPWEDKLVSAVEAGEVAESTIDEHLRRLLRLADRVGALGAEREWPTALPAPNSAPRRDQLRRLAAGGMTVLTNTEATLPLDGTETVAVIGRHAVETVAQGGGSAQVRPPHVVSVADGLVGALGHDRVSVVDGVEVRRRPAVPAVGTLRDPEGDGPGMRVVTRDAAGAVLRSRHVEHTEIATGHGGWTDGAASIELSAQVEISYTTRMEVGLRGVGEWTFEVHGHREQVRTETNDDPGEGIINPPAWTTEAELEPRTTITATVHRPAGQSILGLAARPTPPAPAETIAAGTRAASNTDVAVVVVGLTQEQETEAQDKASLALPGEQDAMVTAVAAAATRTVVVVNAATPVLMPWLNQVDAVLWVGLPGQEAGTAVASALLGETEPAGRLVTTFPTRDSEGPAWSTVPVDGALAYTEGTAVGYRGWDHRDDVEPLFWFGHGLGYTTWKYGQAEITEVGEAIRAVRAEVTNTGERAGRETVQVYLRPDEHAEPVRLIGWAGVYLQPGESTRVEVPCDTRAQRIWNTAAAAWQPLSGDGNVLIARGLGDVRVILPEARSAG